MKKKEFLEELDRILTQKNYPDKEDVIKDFEEHFRIGEEEGKSEEEIAKLLGNPKDIAEQFKEEEEDIKKETLIIKNEDNKETNQIKKENDSITKLILALVLIFFNLVFVLGITTGIFGTVLGFFIAFIAIAVARYSTFSSRNTGVNIRNNSFTNIFNVSYYDVWRNWYNCIRNTRYYGNSMDRCTIFQTIY